MKTHTNTNIGWAAAYDTDRFQRSFELRLNNGMVVDEHSGKEGDIELRSDGQVVISTTVDQLLEMIMEARKAADKLWK